MAQPRVGVAQSAGRDATALEQYALPAWQAHAACRDSTVDFFTEPQRARKVCQHCPVRIDCLRMALTFEAGRSIYGRHGVFGGLEPYQRLQLEHDAQGLNAGQTAAAAVSGQLPVVVRATPPRGAAVSRLDGDTWAVIRRLYRAGTPQVRLAERFGIAQSRISVMCAREE